MHVTGAVRVAGGGGAGESAAETRHDPAQSLLLIPVQRQHRHHGRALDARWHVTPTRPARRPTTRTPSSCQTDTSGPRRPMRHPMPCRCICSTTQRCVHAAGVRPCSLNADPASHHRRVGAGAGLRPFLRLHTACTARLRAASTVTCHHITSNITSNIASNIASNISTAGVSGAVLASQLDDHPYNEFDDVEREGCDGRQQRRLSCRCVGMRRRVLHGLGGAVVRGPAVEPVQQRALPG